MLDFKGNRSLEVTGKVRASKPTNFFIRFSGKAYEVILPGPPSFSSLLILANRIASKS